MSIDQSIAQKIGKYTKYQREKKKYSLNEFAKRVDLDVSFIMRLENGVYQSIKFDVIEKLAHGFEMDIENFLRKCQITSSKNKANLPSIEFYMKETYQFPDEAIEDLKLFIQVLKLKYKNQIGKMKKAHNHYWEKKEMR